MSYRSSRKGSRGKTGSMRGPSRPINARNAPGAAPRRISNVAIASLAVGLVAVLVLVFFLATQNNSGSATNPNTTANNLSPEAATTQTASTFATQTAPDILPRISIQDAKALYDKNDATFIDVRVAESYATQHIKGAINVPQAEASKHLAEIPKTGNVIVYCDCPHDEESSGVAYNLRFSAGYTNVKILQGPTALDEWRNAGYPVEP